MKLIAGIFSGVFALTMVSCDNVGETGATDDDVRTETEVVGVDTVGAETTYDVRKKEITEVDTVGATTEYDVEKQVVRKTVDIDTVTEDVDAQTRQEMEEGDYKVVDRDVENETVTKEVEVDSK